MVVYIVLGILYESYIHPITILSGLPSAGFGALLTLVIFHIDLSIYAFVGLIMLIGIVKKNAIMQIDFALEAERMHNLTAERAIYEGCLIRFRPIMMTTMAALLGAVPIALGYGAGGEARQPLGPGGGRRTAVLAVGDALPHAGLLHLHVRATGSRQRLETPWQESPDAPRSTGDRLETFSLEGPRESVVLDRRHKPLVCPT